MPTMEIPIKNVPTFGMREKGYVFTGNLSLPEIVTMPIQINSMSLYYGYGRRYVRYVFLEAKCGDTTFKTDYFSLKPDETLKKLTVNCNSMVAGADHLLKQDGRTITFTIRGDYGSSDNTIDRPRAGDMLLTVNYTLLFEKSPYTLDRNEAELGTEIKMNIQANALNAEYNHTWKLVMGELAIEGQRVGPGDVLISIPKNGTWLAAMPESVQKEAKLTVTTQGAGQTAEESKNIIIKVPEDVKPSIAGVTIQRIDGRVPSSWGMYLKGESSAKITIETASPGEGSTIAGYRIEGAGFAANSQQLVTGKLVATGYQTITATVTDARGRSSSQSIEIYVNAYQPPLLARVDAYRVDSLGAEDDTGTKIAGSIEYAITEIADNKPTFIVRVGGVETALTRLDAEDGIAVFQLSGIYEATASYEVTVELRDMITAQSENAASLADKVATASVAFHILPGGSGAAFGMYQEHEKRLSIPDDWRYYRGDRDLEAWVQELVQSWGGGSGGGVDMKAVLAAVYPVGAIYLAINPTSPAELFGGYWIQLDDRLLDGSDGSTLAVHLWQRVEEGEVLPEITEDDEGLFLRVVNGEMVWDKLEWKEAN